MIYTRRTQDKRYQKLALHDAGHLVREIALAPERHASTISRELRRNRNIRGYRPLQAQMRAYERCGMRRRCRMRISARQWRGIVGLIHRHLSPKRIA